MSEATGPGTQEKKIRGRLAKNLSLVQELLRGLAATKVGQC